MAVSLHNQIQLSPSLRSRGFALPTILIASVVMLTVLLVSVTSTTAIRTAMFNQYYSQLAQAAGEAGVEYAKACLNASANVPGWSDAKPLMPNTDCSGNVQGGYSAYVMTSGNIRSGFSLSMPTLDSSGRAKTLPNSGYVEITRTSNGAVWRRYNQPSVQAAVVPDLCSGTATSSLGWVNATKFASADAFPDSTAQKIGLSTSSINPGPMYLRKDFSVTKDGSYSLKVLADDLSDVYIDNSLILNTSNLYNVNEANKNLAVGCHTIMVKLTNKGILVNPASLMFSLKADDSSSPIVVSDTTWRVAAGLQKHYSTVDYYADPVSWTAIRDISFANTIAAGWGPTSGDYGARWINTTHSYDGSGNYPSGQFTLFRDNRNIYIPTTVTVRVSMLCDYACYPYIDGNLINTGISWPQGVVTMTVTLTEGYHKLAFLASNDAGASGFALAVVNTSTGELVTHTDSNWSAAYFWSATNPTNSTSYDNSYKPNPNPTPESNVSVLAVAGGGGGGGFGGGAGAGGFVYKDAYTIGLGAHSVVVGAGGVGAATNAGLPGNNGGSSVFETIIAVGGGGGGTRNADSTSNVGASGGSGGGSSMGNAGAIAPAGIGILGQGMAGGLGRLGTAPHLHGGGGGAGAVGGNAVAPNAGAGGAGLTNSITGASVYYAGGGGGGTYTDGTYVVGPGGIGGGGAGQSILNAAGGAGTPNTGGGGGGSGYGGAGGLGGSGVVIIRYPTGSMTATGGTITTSGGYTIHRFTSSGTFTVASIL